MTFICPVCGKEFDYYFEDGGYNAYLAYLESLITHAFEHLKEITRGEAMIGCPFILGCDYKPIDIHVKKAHCADNYLNCETYKVITESEEKEAK